MQEEETASSDGSGHAGARAIPTAPSVDERRAIIRGMMERFEWERGKSAPILAAAWGLAVSTVERDSVEVSRLLTADADEVRRDITVGARELMRDALKNKRAGEFAKLGELLATVSGAKAPEQRIITNTASPSEASRLVREAFGEKATPKLNGSSNGHTNGHANGSGS